MELAVDRSRKTVMSPANASPINGQTHKLAALDRSPRAGSAVHAGVEEAEIDNYAPWGVKNAVAVF